MIGRQRPAMDSSVAPYAMIEHDETPPIIAELGHVGIRCLDLPAQVAFYRDIMGLTVTDADQASGLYFLSARPWMEHHELLLASGRDAPIGSRLIQQLSFRCPSLADVAGFLRRLKHFQVNIDAVVSHGNAVGVYFFDPEGNRCELYCQTGLVARQPFVQPIDLERDPDTILAEIAKSVKDYGESGYMPGHIT